MSTIEWKREHKKLVAQTKVEREKMFNERIPPQVFLYLCACKQKRKNGNISIFAFYSWLPFPTLSTERIENQLEKMLQEYAVAFIHGNVWYRSHTSKIISGHRTESIEKANGRRNGCQHWKWRQVFGIRDISNLYTVLNFVLDVENPSRIQRSTIKYANKRKGTKAERNREKQNEI